MDVNDLVAWSISKTIEAFGLGAFRDNHGDLMLGSQKDITSYVGNFLDGCGENPLHVSINQKTAGMYASRHLFPVIAKKDQNVRKAVERILESDPEGLEERILDALRPNTQRLPEAVICPRIFTPYRWKNMGRVICPNDDLASYVLIGYTATFLRSQELAIHAAGFLRE